MAIGPMCGVTLTKLLMTTGMSRRLCVYVALKSTVQNQEEINLVKHLSSCQEFKSWIAFSKKYLDPWSSEEEASSSEEEASILHSQEIEKIRDKQASSSNPGQRDGSNDGVVVKLVPAAGSLGYWVACRHLSRMMASHGHGCDSSLVENINFKKFLDSIGFEVPKREDIGKMCDDYKKKATGNISSEQIRHSSRSKTAAGWASLSVGTVRILYTLCNFIDGDEWKLHRVIIGARVAVPLAPDYTGPSLLASLDDKVLNDAVLRDISDHTSRPNTLVVGVFMPQGITENIRPDLYKQIAKIKEDISHISIKDLMQQKEEAERPQSLICSTYVDDVLHSVAQCLVPEESSPIIQQMRTNMKTLERFTQNCHQTALPYPGLDYPRSYDKQWYSLYCCLKILTGDNNDDSTLKVWGQIDQSIKEISKPSCPTSHLCLVKLFNVRNVLQSELERADNNDAAGAAGYEGA